MKSTRFYFGRATLILSAILFVFAFAGCKVDDDNPALPEGIEELSSSDKLIGKWTSSYAEIFEITQTTFSNSSSYGDSYAGDNLVVGRLTSDSGYIYIKYTRAMNVDYSYSETAPDVGKWYAIAYKNLTDSSIQLSGASKDGGKTSTDTLEEAISEFTIANGYFDYYSDCTK